LEATHFSKVVPAKAFARPVVTAGKADRLPVIKAADVLKILLVGYLCQFAFLENAEIIKLPVGSTAWRGRILESNINTVFTWEVIDRDPARRSVYIVLLLYKVSTTGDVFPGKNTAIRIGLAIVIPGDQEFETTIAKVLGIVKAEENRI